MAVNVVSFLPIFLTRCIFIYSCVNFLSMVVTLKECTTIDHCSCSTDEGKISLWELAGTGKPRFSGIPIFDLPDWKISWNPCNSYSEDKCQDVAWQNAKLNKQAANGEAGFNVERDKIRSLDTNIVNIEGRVACLHAKSQYGIAKQNTATCVLKDGECALKYTGETIGKIKSIVSIKLRCNESQEGHVDPVNLVLLKVFTTVLHSKYACPRVSPLSSSSRGLSLGSILVIIFFCLVTVYIISGILVNKYIRSVEGNKAFPNYSFWMDLPYLIKDGCVFTFHSLQSLCGKGTRRSGYASI